MTTCHLVLSHCDLLKEIVQYQHGVHCQVKPFVQTTLLCRLMKFVDCFECVDSMALTLEELDTQLMKPWFALYNESYFHRLMDYNPLIIDGLLYYAVYHDHRHLVEYMTKHFLLNKVSAHLLDMAAWQGNMQILMHLDSMGFTGCTHYAMDLAASRGHLSIVKYLHHNRQEGCSSNAIDHAAASGALDVVRYLHYQGKTATTRAIDGAAARGHLHVIKFLLNARTEGCTKKAFLSAKFHGHLDVLTCLHESQQACKVHHLNQFISVSKLSA